jgi:Flp pilus assembly protein TadD
MSEGDRQMKMRIWCSLTVLLLFLVVSVPVARPQSTNELEKYSKSFAPKNERSSKAAGKVEWSRREPSDGQEWFSRGYELHNSDRYPEAIEAFKRAIDLGYRKATAMYNVACGYSLLNDKENAFGWLKRALENQFGRTELLMEDSDLDPLRTDPRFKQILAIRAVDNHLDPSGNVKGSAKPDRLEQANSEFARLERETSTDGNKWSSVGLQLLRLRVLDRSIIALNQAVTHLDHKGATAMYNLACSYALKGDRDNGLLWIEKSVNAGFDSPDKLRNDPDIASLRSDPRFSRVEKLSNTLSLSQFHENTDGLKYSGNRDYSKRRWAPAIKIYEGFVRTEPSNGRAWFNLGYALHYSHEHARAIAAFEHALELGYRKPTTTYNIACAHAMLNQRDSALVWLERAIKAGFESYGQLSSDDDLDNLRSDPRFERIVNSADFRTRIKTGK